MSLKQHSDHGAEKLYKLVIQVNVSLLNSHEEGAVAVKKDYIMVSDW